MNCCKPKDDKTQYCIFCKSHKVLGVPSTIELYIIESTKTTLNTFQVSLLRLLPQVLVLAANRRTSSWRARPTHQPPPATCRSSLQMAAVSLKPSPPPCSVSPPARRTGRMRRKILMSLQFMIFNLSVIYFTCPVNMVPRYIITNTNSATSPPPPLKKGGYVKINHAISMLKTTITVQNIF